MITTNQGKNEICWESKLDQLLSDQSKYHHKLIIKKNSFDQMQHNSATQFVLKIVAVIETKYRRVPQVAITIQKILVLPYI